MSPLVATPGRREESRRGTQECVRHGSKCTVWLRLSRPVAQAFSLCGDFFTVPRGTGFQEFCKSLQGARFLPPPPAAPTPTPTAGARCAAHPQAARALERFLKNRSRGRPPPRTLSTASPNSRSPTPPRSATGFRADAPAYTPARGGGLREKTCSTAFPGQPAKAEPSRLCETSRRGLHNGPAPQRASPRSERRSRPIPHGPAPACSARD